jgi:transposase
MSRSLTVRQPRPSEVRQLQQWLEADHLTNAQRRQAEAILLHADGWSGIAIAASLGVHANTVYAALHDFDREGLAAVEQVSRGGAPPRLTAAQEAAIVQRADQPPSELGLPYGRWSLAKLRDYLIRQRILKTISREHLRRVLKKGGSDFGACSANSAAVIRDGPRF